MSATLDRQAKRLHQIVTELVRAYQFRDREEICCHGITVSQCYALQAMVDHGGQRVGEISDRLNLTISAATRLLDQLEEKGFAARVPDPDDRRACRVEATATGAALSVRIHDEMIGLEKDVLRRVGSGNREAVIEALGELSSALAGWRRRGIDCWGKDQSNG